MTASTQFLEHSIWSVWNFTRECLPKSLQSAFTRVN